MGPSMVRAGGVEGGSIVGGRRWHGEGGDEDGEALESGTLFFFFLIIFKINYNSITYFNLPLTATKTSTNFIRLQIKF